MLWDGKTLKLRNVDIDLSNNYQIGEINKQIEENNNNFNSSIINLDTKISNITGEIESVRQDFKVGQGEFESTINTKIKDLTADVEVNFKDVNEKIAGNVTGIANLSSQIKQTESSITQSVSNQIKAVNDKISKESTGIRSYVQDNYSTKTQTADKISSEISSVKKLITDGDNGVKTYLQKNYSTTLQTSSMIQNKVSSYDSRLGSVESKIIQTAEKIESKVSAGDVYSLIEQMPSYVKISAKNIDLTGNVSVVGDFMTASYGKRVYIEGSEIKFYDSYGSFIGKIGIDTDSSLNIQGSYSQDASILMNTSKTISFTNFNNKVLSAYLYGDWGTTNFYSFSLSTRYAQVDRDLTVYNNLEVNNKLTITRSINFGDTAYIKLTSAGNQMWIGRTYDDYDFIIDFANKKTFWA